MDSIVGAGQLPGSVRFRTRLGHVDYADRFTVPAGSDATPEQWARALFGDRPNPGQIFVWRVLLGLRLARVASAATVAGWRIGDRGDGWLRMEADSWFLAADLVVQTTGEQASLTTFLRYDRRLAHLVWPPLSAAHRRIVPALLTTAAARLRRPVPARA